jgi:hypothetical protein
MRNGAVVAGRGRAGKVLVSAGETCNAYGMGKGRLILVTVIILAAAGVMGWMLLSLGPQEPVYKGKPLSYWLEGYDPSGGAPNYQLTHPNAPTYQEASEAVRKLGTNAIPTLLRKLRQRDSKAKEMFMNLLRKQHVIKISPPRTTQYIEPLDGFKDVGVEASNAVPQLVALFEHDPSPVPQMTIPAILSDMGPAAEAAVPAMLRGMTHTNAVVRNNAIYALRKINADPKLVVPELIKSLKDPDIMVRAQAIRALEDFSTNAEATVPALLELWRKEPPLSASTASSRMGAGVLESWLVSSAWITNPYIGWSSPDLHGLAGKALEAIDPAAAAKAGVITTNKAEP